ncbi:conserved protein of unknown function [Candidatus Hydrogenisulfobacillus filiaventi]|uniref:DUF3243 domain-containing protein n=1 Tax=Candidatus Hydrogenisulfobacillus filiaventi TaxID=2707344 RepID=A0A6F8ZGA5_9FIRM|nr:DUF3243 family protein [Bacillota bacterium]CAB1128968.1 conserved protein of unknown function [Candidatus Hydrogenisulfobacillus filiaventi]
MSQAEVPQSFEELKSRVTQRMANGSVDVKQDIIEMGDAMLQSGVEPKTVQDQIAKRLWQAAGQHDKEVLADLVARMAKEELQ